MIKIKLNENNGIVGVDAITKTRSVKYLMLICKKRTAIVYVLWGRDRETGEEWKSQGSSLMVMVKGWHKNMRRAPYKWIEPCFCD